MSSLVDSLRQVGKVHARGQFTLDLEQADSKMARFQFREEHEFLYQLVGGLYRLGAQEVAVDYRKDVLTIAPDCLSIPKDYPAQMASQVFEEFSPWRRCAAACQAILAHEPQRFQWIGSAPEQSYDYRTGEARGWNKVQLREIQVVGLPSSLVLKALDELQRRAVYSRRKLSLRGVAQSPWSGPLAPVGGHPGRFGCRVDSKSAWLVLVVDEMSTGLRTIETEIPWWGVVYWDSQRVCMDASLAAVVEDDAFAAFLQSIPNTFAGAVRELAEDWQQPGGRDFLLSLLRPPAAAWLSPIYTDLCRLEFFQDQRQERWSLLSLQRQSEVTASSVYYSDQPPPMGLPETILNENSPLALEFLQIHLGEQLVEATPLVLQDLQRQANFRSWQERPQVGLKLPHQNWLIQESFDDCRIGVPDDWCQPGGAVTLMHQGKFLARRTLAHPEVTFVVVCEVAEDQISPLWDGLQEESWQLLTSLWLERLGTLLERLSQGQDHVSPMRDYLMEHLARSQRPEESYFASTLLFRDWLGQLHSIYSLLQARAEGYQIGYLAGSQKPEDYPEPFLPKALFIAGDALTRDLLFHVKALSTRDFDLLLEDLDRARQLPAAPELDQPWAVDWVSEEYQARLQVCPTWGQGEVILTLHGIPVEVHPIDSELGFVAHVRSDEFRPQIRTANQALGKERYTVANLANWRHCQEDLLERAKESLHLRCQSLSPDEEGWAAWIHEAVLYGHANEFRELAEMVCLPSFPDDLSLTALGELEAIQWCSHRPDEGPVKEFLAHHEVKHLIPLSPFQQQAMEAAYGGNWVCVDGWFAQNSRLRKFLERPAVVWGHSQTLASIPARPPLQGLLMLVDDATLEGCVDWHYRQRYVMSDKVPSAWALAAQVECERLQPNDKLTSLEPEEVRAEQVAQVREQLVGLLVDWLSRPRPEQPHLCRLWMAWQRLGPEVTEGLRRQPWIPTNHGHRSWQELMELPDLYRLPTAPAESCQDLTLVLLEDCPVGLVSQLVSCHPHWVSVEDTQALLAERELWREQQVRLDRHAALLAKYPLRAPLQAPNRGEVALLGEAHRCVWLVLPDFAALVHNVPAGLTGYLQTEEFHLRKVGDGQQAELGPLSRDQILRDAQPLVLARIEQGGLVASDLEWIADYCLHSYGVGDSWMELLEARWLPCADGTRVSLEQLRLEAEEQNQLLYWEKTYPLAGSRTLTPILSTPILLELVGRCCGLTPVLRPKPLLFRDLRELGVPRLSNLRQVIEGVGRWFRQGRQRGVVQALRRVMGDSDHLTKGLPVLEGEAVEGLGLGLLTSLRRQAGLMLQGEARSETLRCLDQVHWVGDPRPGLLWSLTPENGLCLNAHHPVLRGFLEVKEPPAPVTWSLLLGRVSAINARSEAFSDDMEREFLEKLLGDVVASYRDLIPVR